MLPLTTHLPSIQAKMQSDNAASGSSALTFFANEHMTLSIVWTSFGKKGLTTCEYDALLRWNGHQQIPSRLLGEPIPKIRKQQAARVKMLIGQYGLEQHQILYIDFR